MQSDHKSPSMAKDKKIAVPDVVFQTFFQSNDLQTSFIGFYPHQVQCGPFDRLVILLVNIVILVIQVYWFCISDVGCSFFFLEAIIFLKGTFVSPFD